MRALRDKDDFAKAAKDILEDIVLLKRRREHKLSQLHSIYRRCVKRIDYMTQLRKQHIVSNDKMISKFKQDCLRENLINKTQWLNEIIPQKKWALFEPTFLLRNQQLLKKVSKMDLSKNIPNEISELVRDVFEYEYLCMMTAYQQLDDLEKAIRQNNPYSSSKIECSKLVIIAWMKSMLINTQFLPKERMQKVQQYAELERTQHILSQDMHWFNQLREIVFAFKSNDKVLCEKFYHTFSFWENIKKNSNIASNANTVSNARLS